MPDSRLSFVCLKLKNNTVVDDVAAIPRGKEACNMRTCPFVGLYIVLTLLQSKRHGQLHAYVYMTDDQPFLSY